MDASIKEALRALIPFTYVCSETPSQTVESILDGLREREPWYGVLASTSTGRPNVVSGRRHRDPGHDGANIIRAICDDDPYAQGKINMGVVNIGTDDQLVADLSTHISSMCIRRWEDPYQTQMLVVVGSLRGSTVVPEKLRSCCYPIDLTGFGATVAPPVIRRTKPLSLDEVTEVAEQVWHLLKHADPLRQRWTTGPSPDLDVYREQYKDLVGLERREVEDIFALSIARTRVKKEGGDPTFRFIDPATLAAYTNRWARVP